MPNLKAVEFGFNKFCGPSVLSILTGKSTDQCAVVISRVNGQYNVTGVTTYDLCEAARRLGFDVIDMRLTNMSLYRGLVSLASKGNAQYIVSVVGHFVCVEVTDNKIYFCDNHTKAPIPAASSARLGMMVTHIHKVVRRPDFVEAPPPKPKPAWVTVIRIMCPECYGMAEESKLIIHISDCKWRDYVESND